MMNFSLRENYEVRVTNDEYWKVTVIAIPLLATNAPVTGEAIYCVMNSLGEKKYNVLIYGVSVEYLQNIVDYR